VPYLVELQQENGAVVSSSHCSYSAVYEILFCAEEELIHDQNAFQSGSTSWTPTVVTERSRSPRSTSS
jgi:hypothetical protein